MVCLQLNRFPGRSRAHLIQVVEFSAKIHPKRLESAFAVIPRHKNRLDFRIHDMTELFETYVFVKI